MAKAVNIESMAIVLELGRDDEGAVTVECRASYVVTSEGVKESRTKIVALTPAQETTVKNFAQACLTDIQTDEGI